MSMTSRLALPPLALPLLGLMLAGCAARGCDNPYVLDYVEAADRRSDLAHLGLVRDAVRSDPAASPNAKVCTVWERVRNPAYGPPNQPEALLRPQRYTITQVDDGWRVEGLPLPPGSGG